MVQQCLIDSDGVRGAREGGGSRGGPLGDQFFGRLDVV